MLNDMDLGREPFLDAPGAGLPWYELAVARVLVGWRARRTSRGEASAVFARERAAVVGLARRDGEAEGGRRVLIRRLPGLEDSSRYWSVFMVVEHLRIVTEGATVLIGELVRGETPARAVHTQDVKPRAEVDGRVVDAFERACDTYELAIGQIPDLRSEMRWAHPWFGPLDAARWHFFSGFHLELHRRQIEAVQAACR